MNRVLRNPALRATVNECRAFLARATEALARSRREREALRRGLSQTPNVQPARAFATSPANEGAFLACSCWMADCLALQGRHAETVVQFERLLAVDNDLGLFAEEYNVPARHLTGNFPQALTHLAMSLGSPVLTRGA